MFSFRAINIWNSLPEYVVEADSINPFRSWLDEHWANEDVVFNFN